MLLRTGCHPLDPLTPEEISAAAGAIKVKAAELSLPELRFNVITLAVSHPFPHPQQRLTSLSCLLARSQPPQNDTQGRGSHERRSSAPGFCNCSLWYSVHVPGHHMAWRTYLEYPSSSRAMQEPTKADLIAFDKNPDDVPQRAANIIVQAFPVAPLIEATVLLAGAKPCITSWTEVQPSLPREYVV